MEDSDKGLVDQVDHEYGFLVGVRFTNNDAFLGDPFEVLRMVKDELGKMKSVRVTRSQE